MICWSCARAAAATTDAVCASCGAIQPPGGGDDHFSVLGFGRRYDIDLVLGEGRFRELSRQFHPDRFAKADPRARRASLQRTVQLNEAWRTIKDPVARAEYLLHLAGYEVGAEQGASRPGANAARERIPVPPALLGEILELREELSEARAARDDARVQGMASAMRARCEAALVRVAAALGAGDGATPDFEAAARELIAIRYFRRFLDEVDAHDEAVASGDQGAVHA